MAITSSINFDKVSGGIKSLNTGMGQLKKSADNVKSVTLNRTKIKRESIVRNRMLSNIREEAVKRKDQESIIEASGISGAFKRTGSVIANSTKGFLGRLLDFASSLLLGWLLYNLPTIMTGIENLIIRIKSLYTILTDFMSNIKNTFQDFGNLLSAVYLDITQFDFTDQSKRVQNAMNDLNTNLDSMHDEFMKGFKLLTTPLGQGPGEKEVPPLNTDYTQPGPTTGGDVSGYGTKEQQALLKTIRFAEGTAGPTGYSMFFGDKYGKSKYGDLTKLSANEVEKLVTKFLNDPQSRYGGGKSAAVGAFQIIDITAKARALRMDMNRKFDQSFQDEMALRLAAARGVTSDVLKREGLSETVIKKLSPEWASFPGNTYGQPTKRSQDLKSVYQSSLTSPTKPTQVSQSPSGKGGKVIQYITGDRTHKRYAADHGGLNYHDHVAFDSQATRDSAMKWLRSRGWTIGSINTGKHANDSYHYSNQAFDIPFYDGGNYRKKGVTDDAKGETKFSSMVRADLIAGGFGGPQLGGSSIAPLPPLAQVSPTTSPGQNVPSITQNKKGQQVVVVDDRQPPAPQQVISRGGGGSQSVPFEDSLNSLIKNQILLELAYT